MTFCQYIDKLDLTFDDPTEKKARLLLLYEEYWKLERIKECNCECGSKFLREHLPKHKRRKRLPFSSSIRAYETSYQRNKRLLEEKEFKNIQKDMKEKEEKIKDWNFWTKLGIIASIILAFGTLWYFEETRKREEEEERRRQEEHRKKYPKIDVELAQQLFEQKNLPSFSQEEITNKDIEDTMKKVVDLAKKENAIYLVYGENGIGKSTALKKTLSKIPNLHYIYIEKGIEELVKKLVPDYDSTTSHYTIENIIDNSLTEYGNYKREMRQKDSQKFQENAIIVFDNTNKIKDEKFLSEFKDIIKISLVDGHRPLVFIFLSSEGKAPQILMRNMSRMKVTRINEPSKQVTMEYFQKLSIPTDFHLELERITRSVFKYMKELSSIDKNLSKDEFIETAKKNVHSKIKPEITKWLIKETFLEIIQVCDLILKNGSISLNEY
eukprot:gene11716-5055_t